jgi:hypothetical protein
MLQPSLYRRSGDLLRQPGLGAELARRPHVRFHQPKDGWSREDFDLTIRLLQKVSMQVVALESPYAGDVPRNTAYAHACVRECALRYGEAAFAMHLYMTHALDDLVSEERDVGIEGGLALIEALQAKTSVVYVDLGVTPGMRKGIDSAWEKGRTVLLARLGGGRFPVEKGRWDMVDFFAARSTGWEPPTPPPRPAQPAPSPAQPAPPAQPEGFDAESLQDGDVVVLLHSGTGKQADYVYAESGEDVDPEAFKKSMTAAVDTGGWLVHVVTRKGAVVYRHPTPEPEFHADPPPYVAPVKAPA